MDSQLFMDEEEPDEEDDAETANVQICIFSSHWWLNDELHVSASPLIFVGSTKVECKLKLSECMERNMNRTNNRFKIGEQPCLNVAKYSSGWEDGLQDFERTMFSNENILTNSGMANSSIYKLSNTSKSSKLVMTHSTGSIGYGQK